MAFDKISADLTSRLIAMAEISEESSLSEGEKAGQLKIMKQEVLEKIKAEITNVTISSQVMLENIRTLVTNEEWAKLPTSKQISNAIAILNSVALEMKSIESKSTPDIQELMRFYLEIIMRQMSTELKTEILASGQQWEAIHKQKRTATEAAEQEKQSGIISGSCAIATAVLTAAVKTAITVVSIKTFKNKSPSGDLKEKNNEMLKKNENVQDALANKQTEVDQVETKIYDNEVNLKSRQTAPLETGETKKMRRSEIDARERTIAKQREVLQEKKLELDVIEKKASITSARVASITAQIDTQNNKASRTVQQWRALDEICGSMFSIIEKGGNIGAAFLNQASANSKIESDMYSFMSNYFSTMLQNSRKDKQDIIEAGKSIVSNAQATLQPQLSADSFAIRI